MALKATEPTTRQLEVLETVISYIDRMGYPPTRRRLADLLQLRNVGTVKDHLDELVRFGYIELGPSRDKRAIRIKRLTDGTPCKFSVIPLQRGA